jgi:hypothetical protein
MSDNIYSLTPFCEFLDAHNGDNPSPLIGLIKRLKKLYYKAIKSQQMLFREYDGFFDDVLLDSLINEILSHYQIKGVEVSDIQYWLDENEISIDDIENYKYPKSLKGFFELPYDLMSTKYDVNKVLQDRKLILDFFKDKYAKQLLDFLQSKKRIIQIEEGKAKNVTSEELVGAILSNFKSLGSIQWSIEKETEPHFLMDDELYTEVVEKYEHKKNLIEEVIKDLFKRLYIQSANDNYYYYDCPAKVYKENFLKRFNDYKAISVDAEEEDFLIYEVEHLTSPHLHRLLKQKDKEYHYSEFIEYEENYKVSIRKKLQFLSEKLKKYGKKVEIIENTLIKDPHSGNVIGYGTDAVIKTFKEVPVSEQYDSISLTSQAQDVSPGDNSPRTVIKATQNFNSNIFKTKEAEDWFLLALDELNAIDENKKAKSGFQSRVSAIFYNTKCKNHIFKYQLKLYEFIAFLKLNFNANITSDKKLSSGNNHEVKVESLVKQYITSISE